MGIIDTCTKKCISCNEFKVLKEYDIYNNNKRRADCKDCRKITNKEVYERRKDKCKLLCSCGQYVSTYNKNHVNTKKHIKLKLDIKNI